MFLEKFCFCNNIKGNQMFALKVFGVRITSAVYISNPYQAAWNPPTEVATRDVLQKKLLLKISQNLLESTCVGVSF